MSSVQYRASPKEIKYQVVPSWTDISFLLPGRGHIVSSVQQYAILIGNDGGLGTHGEGKSQSCVSELVLYQYQCQYKGPSTTNIQCSVSSYVDE